MINRIRSSTKTERCKHNRYLESFSLTEHCQAKPKSFNLQWQSKKILMNRWTHNISMPNKWVFQNSLGHFTETLNSAVTDTLNTAVKIQVLVQFWPIWAPCLLFPASLCNFLPAPMIRLLGVWMTIKRSGRQFLLSGCDSRKLLHILLELQHIIAPWSWPKSLQWRHTKQKGNERSRRALSFSKRKKKVSLWKGNRS